MVRFDAKKGLVVENKGVWLKIELFDGISYFYSKLELFDYWSFSIKNLHFWLHPQKIASVSKISYFQQ